MSALAAASAPATAPSDEHALLRAFDDLLAREAALLADGDADGLHRLADERERLSLRLFDAAAARRARGIVDPARDAELLALYRGLRRGHEVRATVVRRHADKNARALGVLAQASGHGMVYGADGRTSRPWA